MEKSTALSHVKKHVKEQLKPKAETDKRINKILPVLEGLKEEDLSFGPLPKYFCGYLECNSTGVGRSTFGNTETQRTVARDYVTDECLFIDGHEGTCKKGLELLLLKEGQQVNYYKKSEMKKVANKYGVLIHSQYFRDLNFSVSDHRVNRYTFHQTKEEFSAPIRAIFMKDKEEDKKIKLGYVYEKDGQEYVLVEIDHNQIGIKKRLNGLLILLGIMFPPLGFLLLLYHIRTR